MYKLQSEESSHVKHLKNELAICGNYKKFNVNELKAWNKVLQFREKEGKLFKRLINGIQEDNSDKQLSVSLVKEIVLNMFEEQNKKNTRNTEETRGKCYINNQ